MSKAQPSNLCFMAPQTGQHEEPLGELLADLIPSNLSASTLRKRLAVALMDNVDPVHMCFLSLIEGMRSQISNLQRVTTQAW